MIVIDLRAWDARMKARWRPLHDQAAFAVARGDERVGLNADAPFEVGSAFKAFVAAEYARQVTDGRLDPGMQLTIQPVDRVPSSLVVEDIADGGSIALDAAARAMIGVSDNTATDLVLRAVGPERVRALLGELGIAATVPDATKAIYDRVAVEPGWLPEACVTTMADLARFYTATIAQGALGSATERYLALMREEDLVQGSPPAEGATWYRKGGMLEPPPALAMAIGGAIAAADGTVTAFAFALNVPYPADAADEESPLDPMVMTFSEGLRRGLGELAGDGAAAG